VLRWFVLKPLLSSNGSFNLNRWRLFFLHETMCQYRGVFSVEEVQNPIVHSSDLYSKLVDPITQLVSHRSPEFVPHFPEQGDSRTAFLHRATIAASHIHQPIKHRNVPFRFPIVDDFGGRHHT
jgi:hypothetical protein